jgi:predicted AAA+ superfamily ATPase
MDGLEPHVREAGTQDSIPCSARKIEPLEKTIHQLPLADRSIRKQAINRKKLHVVDWALGYPFVPERTIDVGRKLESAVYLHCRRQREDLGYLAGSGRSIWW